MDDEILSTAVKMDGDDRKPTYCTECGNRIPEDSIFCPSCGSRIGAQSEAAEPSERDRSVTHLDPQGPKDRKPLIIAIIAAAVVVIIAVVVMVVLYSTSKADEEMHQPHDVIVPIDAPGYDAEDTLIPVLVEGSDLDGNAVSELAFVDPDGLGITLLKGTYDLTIAASPLTSDGILYETPSSSVTITIDESIVAGSSYRPDSDQAFTLTLSTALAETQDMIDAAYDLAIQDPSQAEKAAALKTKAEQAHADALAAEEARKQEEAARKAQEEFQAKIAGYESQGYEVFTGTLRMTSLAEVVEKGLFNARKMGDLGAETEAMRKDDSPRAVLQFEGPTEVICYSDDSHEEYALTMDSIVLMPPDDYRRYDGQRIIIAVKPGDVYQSLDVRTGILGGASCSHAIVIS